MTNNGFSKDPDLLRKFLQRRENFVDCSVFVSDLNYYATRGTSFHTFDIFKRIKVSFGMELNIIRES